MSVGAKQRVLCLATCSRLRRKPNAPTSAAYDGWLDTSGEPFQSRKNRSMLALAGSALRRTSRSLAPLASNRMVSLSAETTSRTDSV